MAHALHLIAAGVPCCDQLFSQLVKVIPLLRVQCERRNFHALFRAGFLQKSLGGADDGCGGVAAEVIKCGNARHLPLAGDDRAGADKQLSGKQLARLRTQQHLQVLGKAVCLALVGAKHDQRTLGVRG